MLVSPSTLVATKLRENSLPCSRSNTPSAQIAAHSSKDIDEIEAQLISVILHELRNPLSTIALSAGILEEEAGLIQKTKHLRRIQAKVRQITHLLENITLLVRGSSEQLKLHLRSVNLIELCTGLVEEIQFANDTHNLTFDYCNRDQNCQHDTWANAWIDEDLLVRSLANLLYNGVKYSPSGSTVSLSLVRQADSFILKICDTGIGIDPDELPLVFEWFYRGSNSISASGSGLGLSIAKRCVELHQGTITIHSHSDTGTQVTIQLPVMSGR